MTGEPVARRPRRLPRPASPARTVAVLIVVLAMIVGAYACLRRAPQPFSARADLVFVLPANVREQDNAFSEGRSMIYFAGLVEREWDRGRGYPDLASPVAPLAATGLASAVTVTLPNNAGQYEKSFLFQKLIIQTVDPTRAGAQRLLDTTIASLQGISADLQQQLRVRPDDLITTYVNPPAPAASRTRGSPYRSVVGILGLGVMLIAVLNSHRRRRPTTDRVLPPVQPVEAVGPPG